MMNRNDEMFICMTLQGFNAITPFDILGFDLDNMLIIWDILEEENNGK